MSLKKFLCVAAVGVASFGGAASAATVDIMFKFNTAYGVNCDFNNCDDLEEGDFELSLSYDDVTLEEFESYDEGFEAYQINYGGETTAGISTPLGPVAFEATGRGRKIIEFNQNGVFIQLSDSFSSVSEPTSNFLQLGGVYNFRDAETSETNGIRSFAFSSGDLFDVPLFFRFANEDGTFVTGGSAAFDAELTITVSGESAMVPSPVPLPATLPLLAVALGGLGFGTRRLKTRSKAS